MTIIFDLVIKTIQSINFKPIISGLSSLVVPASGAFIAYLVWDIYNTPVIAGTNVDEMEICRNDDHYFTAYRINLKNIGKVAAESCKAYLWLYGEAEDGGTIYFTYMRLGWGNKRSTIISDAKEDYSVITDIGSGDTAHVQTLRCDSQSIRVNANKKSGDITFYKIEEKALPKEKINRIGNDLLIQDTRGRYSEENGIGGIPRIPYEEAEEIVWHEAELLVESTNANNISEGLDIKYSDGELKLELKHKPRMERLKLRVLSIL